MSLKLNRVAMTYGDHELFHDVSTTISSGEKVALVGRNGSGKSTLLRIIAGIETATAGNVHLSGSVVILEQSNAPVTAGIEGLKPEGLRRAELALQRAEAGLADPTGAALDAYATAEETFRVLGGYDFAVKAERVLAGLGLDSAADPARMSGGEQRRLLLARLLLASHDVLLLDEPTNHLDTQSREWLEDWLLASPATVVFVSHDRAFLNRLAGRVLELERGRLNDWPGNLDEAMRLKAVAAQSQQRAWQAQERKRRSLELEMHRLGSMARSAERFNFKRASGHPLILAKARTEDVARTLAGRSKALERRLERSEPLEKPFEDKLTIRIPLPEPGTGPQEVLRAENLGIARGGRAVLDGLNLHVARGQKIALVGANGSGKSSLLKALRGRLAHSGEVVTGQGLTVFEAWQHAEELAGLTTLADAVLDAQSALRRQDLHHLLGQLDLPDPEFKLAELSGGQLTKVALARLAVTRAQLLVLDEPSNNLDLAAITALEELLVAYPGTVLFASHDRQLVANVADVKWLVGDGVVRVVTG